MANPSEPDIVDDVDVAMITVEEGAQETTANPEAPTEPQATAESESRTAIAEATESSRPSARSTSPPLPQRHTPVTPGYRAERLQLLYSKSLERVLSKLAWKNFAECYPTIATKAAPALKQVQAQMVDKLREKCEKEFDNIMTTRQVIPKLNELEGLVAEASDRRTSSKPDQIPPTPPHLLPPDQILSAHLTPSLTQHRSQLNARLQTTQSQNALLHDEVRRQREEIENLLSRLETAVEDVVGANSALEDVVNDLAKEAREAEAAIGAVGG